MECPADLRREHGQGADTVKHNIMVVDDSRVVHAEMKKMLEGSGIEVVSYCRSGEEALQQYESVRPELVTLDIVMPSMTRFWNMTYITIGGIIASSMAAILTRGST